MGIGRSCPNITVADPSIPIPYTSLRHTGATSGVRKLRAVHDHEGLEIPPERDLPSP